MRHERISGSPQPSSLSLLPRCGRREQLAPLSTQWRGVGGEVRGSSPLEIGGMTLGHRAACTACGGVSKTVGTERFNRQEKAMLKRPSVLRRWRTPDTGSVLNARSPWAPRAFLAGGFDKWR